MSRFYLSNPTMFGSLLTNIPCHSACRRALRSHFVLPLRCSSCTAIVNIDYYQRAGALPTLV